MNEEGVSISLLKNFPDALVFLVLLIEDEGKTINAWI